MSNNVDSNYKYNNMDFDALFEEMITFFKNDDSPIKDFDFEGSNIRELIRILAYATNMSLFHTSIALNEMYFSTARLRKNLLKMLPAYSYTPRRNTSSRKFLTIQNNTSSDISIAEFTAFNANGNETLDDKVFYTLEAYVISANSTGIIEVYQSSTGKQIQNFDMTITDDIVEPIIIEIENLSEDYFKVQTIENGSVIEWVQYNDLDSFQNSLSTEDLTLLAEEYIYFLDEIDKGFKLSFSETGIGAIPNPDDGQTITILYMESDGSSTNGFSTSNFSFALPISGLSILSDSNILGANTTGASSGGQDKETLAELKENTIAYFNTQNRAVTEYDYTKLGKSISLIGSTGDIKAYGGEDYSTGARLGNVYIIVRPSNDGVYFFTDSQISEILDFYLKYSIAGITPIIQNPHYINAIIGYNYTFKSLVSDTSSLTTSLNESIKDFYVSNFGETIYVPALIELLNTNTSIESAFIKDTYRILFDTLSTLTGTYKIIPMLSTEISDFVSSDGSFFSDNVYGSTSGSNYGSVIFVNEDENYIVVEQVSGVTDTNFAQFQKGTAYIDTRKDITDIIYDVVPDEKYLYISDTDGFSAGTLLSSIDIALSGAVSGTIQTINKKSSNIKGIWLQLDSISGLTVGDVLVNASGIQGTIVEIDAVNIKVWITYTNGSDYAEGEDLDITTYSAPGAYSIAKRAVLTLVEDVSTITAGDTLTVGAVVGTVELVTGGVGGTVDVWWSSVTDFAPADSLTQAGSGTGTFTIAGGGVGTITNGLGTIGYKLYITDITGTAFEVGQDTEPGDTWGFNTISSASGTTITLSDTPMGLTVGDTICESGGTNTTDITFISGNDLTVTSITGFTAGESLHEGNSWASLITAEIIRVDSVYYDTIDKIVVSDITGLTVGKYMVSENGIGEIAVGGISGLEVELTNITGTFEVGTDNVHQVDADTDEFEPLYTLNGNISDFSTDYILEVDTNDTNLPLFINKLDASDSGMLDASNTKLICDYSYIFNTVTNLDRESIELKLGFGSSDLASMETEQNTKYEVTLEIDSAIATLAVGDYVICSNDGGTTTVTGYVYEIDTTGGDYFITVRYDSGTWLLGASSNNIQKGSSWTAATNEIITVGTPSSPTIVNYVVSISVDNTDFIASVNLVTGDVAFRRAATVVSKTISSVDYTAKTITFVDSSDFIAPGAGTIVVWDSTNYEWLSWNYTGNNGTILSGTDTIDTNIVDGLVAIQDKTDAVRRCDFEFRNKIDKLSLGNRSLFYSSNDLIKEFN